MRWARTREGKALKAFCEWRFWSFRIGNPTAVLLYRLFLAATLIIVFDSQVPQGGHISCYVGHNRHILYMAYTSTHTGHLVYLIVS